MAIGAREFGIAVLCIVGAVFARYVVPEVLQDLTAAGKYEKALQYRAKFRSSDEEQTHREALELDPDFGPAHLNLSAIHIRRSEWDKAAEHASAAIRSSPRDYRGYVNRALASWGRNDLQAALADADRAVELRPEPSQPKLDDTRTKTELSLLRGRIRRAAKDWDGALADFAAARGTNPGDDTSLVERAATLRERGDLEAALAAVNEVLVRGPDWYLALYERARILEAKGDSAGAEADRAKARETEKVQRLIDYPARRAR